MNLSGHLDVGSLSDADLEAQTRAHLEAMGVVVTAPLLLVQAPAPAAEQDDDEPTH